MKPLALIIFIASISLTSFASTIEQYREAAASFNANPTQSGGSENATEAKLVSVTDELLTKAPVDDLQQFVGQMDVMSASGQVTLRRILETLRSKNAEIEVSRFAALLLASNEWKQDPKDDFPRGMIVINNFRSTVGPLLLARIGLRDLPLSEKRLDLLLYHADQWLEFAYDKASVSAGPALLDQIEKARPLHTGGSANIARSSAELGQEVHEEAGTSPSGKVALQSTIRRSNPAFWVGLGSVALVVLAMAFRRIVRSKR